MAIRHVTGAQQDGLRRTGRASITSPALCRRRQLRRNNAGEAQRRGRPRRNVPSGANLLATPSARLSELSSAIFWDSMTSPIGRSPIGRKHSPSVGRPFSSTSLSQFF